MRDGKRLSLAFEVMGFDVGKEWHSEYKHKHCIIYTVKWFVNRPLLLFFEDTSGLQLASLCFVSIDNKSWSRWWFQIFSFTTNLGEMTQFDEHIFQMGCFNHQLVITAQRSWTCWRDLEKAEDNVIFPFVVYWVPWLSWVIIDVDRVFLTFLMIGWIDSDRAHVSHIWFIQKDEVICTPESERLEPTKNEGLQDDFPFLAGNFNFPAIHFRSTQTWQKIQLVNFALG